jgi:predicted nucleic acid-binding protein
MLNKITSNSIVFIDSNIFIYHFLGASEPCTDFLERIEMEDIEAYTSTVVLAEVLHRLMIAEVVEKHGIEPHKVAKFLKQNPEIIPTLEKCENAIKEIPEFKVKILSIGSEAIFQSKKLRKEYNLMTNDSLNLHAVKINGLKDMVTNDSDFDKVEWLTVWKP